jgi:hypothetical protein
VARQLARGDDAGRAVVRFDQAAISGRAFTLGRGIVAAMLRR